MGHSYYSFVPLSPPDLQEIMETMMMFTSTSADQRLLLNAGELRSICSKDWFQKENWHALQQVQLLQTRHHFNLPDILSEHFMAFNWMLASQTSTASEVHYRSLPKFCLPPRSSSSSVLWTNDVSTLKFASWSTTTATFRSQRVPNYSHSQSHPTSGWN